MSKINVKVLDSVTRIEYNGDTYHVKAVDAEAGDVIRMNNGDGVVKHGEYYIVKRVRPDGDPEIELDGGGRCDAGYYDYDVYRKEPAKYREVNREARVGERIKVVNDDESPYAKTGEVGTVFKARSHGVYVDLTENARVRGDGQWHVNHDNYVVLEPIPTFEKGEKVRLISGGGRLPLLGYSNGKIYEVDGESFTGNICINGGEAGYGEGFALPEQLEKVTEEAKAVKPGDWVRITQNQWNWPAGTIVKVVGTVSGSGIRATDGRSTLYSSRYEKVAGPEYARVIGLSSSMNGFEIGDIVKVSESKVGGNHTYELTRKDKWYGYGNSEHLAPATKEDYEEFTKPKLAVGDYAKVVKNIDGDEEFNVGDIRKVTKVDEDDDEMPYATRNLDGSDVTRHYAAELVKATDEEVAKVKEAAKWSAIGRKPGEFKRGDIVEVTGSAFGHEVGTVGELVSGSHFLYPREFGVKANGSVYDHTVSGFKLVCPVEQRFDRK